MKFSKFEDIKAWQLARELCRITNRLVSKKAFDRDYTLRKQMQASSGSVMDNIAEGFDRGNNKEFIYFLAISLGSCSELKSQAYRALDFEYISQEELEELHHKAKEVSATVRGLMNYLQNSELKGFRNVPPKTKGTDAPPSNRKLRTENFELRTSN